MLLALALLPWLLLGLVVPFRLRRRPRLSDFPHVEEPEAPLVSVILPARNEAANLAACMTTIIASRYPRRELLVVDDCSVDGTLEIARAIAARSPVAVEVIRGEPLPPGWVGKPWACAQGAARARGELLLFTDADTRHDEDLIGRAVGALRATGSSLVSVAVRQVLVGFWERLLMPHVFVLLWLRWPDPAAIQRVRRPRDAIAGGAFILVPRAVYDRVGGHEAVREQVVEDVSLAQRVVAGGGSVWLGLAEDLIETRMYRGFREIVGGWTKNLAAGSRLSVPSPVRMLVPWLLAAFVLAAWVAPAIGLVAWLLGFGGATLLGWSTVSAGAGLFFWIVVRARYRAHPLFALLYPFGAAIVAGIVLRSASLGRRFSWKGREYEGDLGARRMERQT